MSRIPTYRTGYDDPPTPPVVPPPSPGATHNEVSNGYYCEGWTAPEYPPMNGEGPLCDDGEDLNRYLNFPRRLQGETASATKYEDIGLAAVKDALRLVYIPAGIAPDPVYGNYINLYKIFLDNLGVPASAFSHGCFAVIDVCSPPEYVPGYLDVPIPFISFQPTDPGGGDGDPGFTATDPLVTSVYMSLNATELCITANKVTLSRQPGSNTVVAAGAAADEPCVDVTDCPPETGG